MEKWERQLRFGKHVTRVADNHTDVRLLFKHRTLYSALRTSCRDLPELCPRAHTEQRDADSRRRRSGTEYEVWNTEYRQPAASNQIRSSIIPNAVSRLTVSPSPPLKASPSLRLPLCVLCALCFLCGSSPLPPDEARARFTVPADLRLDEVLVEPLVAQPVFCNFDERGRLWVVQYRQYPAPAGLTMVSHDKFWRAVYDKVPPPPPHHFPGKDKITIHEDTDGDGVFDRHKTFVDGLNIATACVRGRGGVWVLNPPYLLFYRDANHDDVPDGDPEVHLSGFGLEDTHSVVNSLCWGPDGWLYAAQGSTVTADVKRPGDKKGVPSMGQLIWRYHPETRRYEIFAEGGGNAFGVEIDVKGRIFSGHNGGDTRGFHYVQGGYLRKGFEKHGPLSNPYAFGYFPSMKHDKVPRFTHTFVIYDGDALPASYHGKLFGVAPLLSHVVESEITPEGSTFQTKDVGHPITTTDTWFRPVDIKQGPDGALYIADWYDGQTNHYRNQEGQIDTSNGRIYRLAAKDAKPQAAFDLNRKSTVELVELLSHPNKWYRQTALRLIGDRHDRSVLPLLRKKLETAGAQTALESLWALNLSGGFNEDVAVQLLTHADPYVRLWTVRLLCDQKTVSYDVARRLAEMATTEPHVEVRSQLACSARRLQASDSLPIVRNLLARSDDSADPQVPLLLWWAIEAKCETDRDAVLQLFSDSSLWRWPFVSTHILQRVMRRFAATGNRKDLLVCARLLDLAPDADGSARLIKGFEEAYQGRSLANLPQELVEALAKHGGGSNVLALRLGRADAVEKALRIIADEKGTAAQRLPLIQVFGEINRPDSVPGLLRVVEETKSDDLRMAALTALQQYDAAEIGRTVIRLYPKLSEDARSVAQSLLASRKGWALQLLEAVAAQQIEQKAVSLDTVRRLTGHRDARIAELVQKHWGTVEGATTAEMQQQIQRLLPIVRSGSGSPYDGKKLFAATCAKCHRLFGQGGQIGPDLTVFKRDDLDNMLLGIVNPSAEIREGFETVLLVTDDGRTLNGFLVDQDRQVVLLRTAAGQTVTVARDRIEEQVAQRKSLMPEGLLKDLTEQQIRDLFAYLRSTQPLND